MRIDINELVEKRNEARKNKDFALSDKLRAEIEEKGYIIDDTPFGSFVRKKDAEPKIEKPLKVEGFGFKKKS